MKTIRCSLLTPLKRLNRYYSLGAYGERIAKEFLSRKGYWVWQQNWRGSYGKGELDLICVDGKTLICIEVKTKRLTHASTYTALDNFSKEKEQALQKTFYQFILRERGNIWRKKITQTRIDLITIDILATGRMRINHHIFMIPAPALPWIT